MGKKYKKKSTFRKTTLREMLQKNKREKTFRKQR